MFWPLHESSILKVAPSASAALVSLKGAGGAASGAATSIAEEPASAVAFAFGFALLSSGVTWDGSKGHARSVAFYTFTATGRKVENIVRATFEIDGGEFVRHTDVFDFWRWSKQALGAPGMLLGWSSFLRTRVQGQAGKALDEYVAHRAAS